MYARQYSMRPERGQLLGAMTQINSLDVKKGLAKIGILIKQTAETSLYNAGTHLKLQIYQVLNKVIL